MSLNRLASNGCDLLDPLPSAASSGEIDWTTLGNMLCAHIMGEVYLNRSHCMRNSKLVKC